MILRQIAVRQKSGYLLDMEHVCQLPEDLSDLVKWKK